MMKTDVRETDKNGCFIRRERYAGSMSRSFYIGNSMPEEKIHARYEDGILKLTVPKTEPKTIEENGYIEIEG